VVYVKKVLYLQHSLQQGMLHGLLQMIAITTSAKDSYIFNI